MLRTAFALTTLLASSVLAGCATAPAGSAQLRLETAWFEGRRVHYVTTDVSDAAVAQAKRANFVPRLKELLPESATATQRMGSPLERVYAFVDSAQPTVFPSVPLPVGSDSRSLGYTPLWRMVRVTWKAGASKRELKSEEQILDAEDRGELQLQMTDVVLNCPVIAVEGGGALPQP